MPHIYLQNCPSLKKSSLFRTMSIPDYSIPRGRDKNVENVHYPHFTAKNPKRAWIGIFQPNVRNVHTFVLSNYTAAIPTKLCTVIKITKYMYSSWVVPEYVIQIRDGGRQPFKKNIKRDISAIVWPILMKFGIVMHIGPSNPTSY